MLNRGFALAHDPMEWRRASKKNVKETRAIAAPVQRGLRWRVLLREPMLQFLLAGACIFVVTDVVQSTQDKSARTIVIDKALQERLIKLYELQIGSAPTPVQLRQIVDTYRHDEVLYREALALGLDKGDEIVRRRLVQKMDFLLQDDTSMREFEEAALTAYYAAHRTEFAQPDKLDFTQLYFGNDIDSERRARAVQRALQGEFDAAVAPIVTDAEAGANARFLNRRYDNLDRADIARLFGESPLTAALDTLPEGQWSEPVHSGFGWHLLRIDRRVPGTVPSYAEVREKILANLKTQQRERDNQRRFAELQSRYAVQYRDIRG